MKSPFLCTAYMQEDMQRYSGELARQIAKRFVALHYCHSIFVHGVVTLSFSNKFFSDLWLKYVFVIFLAQLKIINLS